MNVDVHRISHEISRNPEAYREDYRKELMSYESLTRLPRQPDKIIRQTLAFLLSHPRMEEGLAGVLIGSLRTIRCIKVRQLVLNRLFSLRNCGLISSTLLLKALLEHSVEFKSILEKCRGIVDEEAIPLMQEYYRRGTDKQRSFCYYIIVYLFSSGHAELEDDVCRGLLCDGKINRMCHFYFLDQIDFEGGEREDPMSLLSEEASKYGKQLLQHILEDKMEREEKIMKMRTYVLFKRRFGLKGSVIPLAMGMINTEKPDVKELITIIISSVTEKDALRVVRLIADNFCSEFKDDEYIVYGLNMMGELYCRFDPTVVMEGMLDGSALGASLPEEKKGFVAQLSDGIMNYIECFRNSKVREVRYAYSAVKDILKHKRGVNRGVDFIRRKNTKEEKVAMSRNGRKRRERGRSYVPPEKKAVPSRFVRGSHSKRKRALYKAKEVE
jgi:hypothetical protein